MDLQVTDDLNIDDCEYILSVARDRDELLGSNPQEVVDYLSDKEVYTLYMEDKCVAITGVIRPWTSRGVLFFIPDPDMPMRAWAHVRHFCLKMIETFYDDPTSSRLEAHIKADFQGAINWVSRLGLEEESLMKNWGPNSEDYYMYRIIK